MTPADLKTAGAALYGPQWQSELARALNVSSRTVRRWASGSTPPPNWLAVELSQLIKRREADLQTATKALRQ